MLNTTIAHYKITDKIGAGGMGEVYRARDTKLDRDVAVKMLPEAVTRLVRTLVDGVQTPGEKRVTWDGRNSQGTPAATGVYFYRMDAPGYTKTRKMVLLK